MITRTSAPSSLFGSCPVGSALRSGSARRLIKLFTQFHPTSLNRPLTSRFSFLFARNVSSFGGYENAHRRRINRREILQGSLDLGPPSFFRASLITNDDGGTKLATRDARTYPSPSPYPIHQHLRYDCFYVASFCLKRGGQYPALWKFGKIRVTLARQYD